MNIITGGVCAPKGFLAGGIKCGIKGGSTKKDLALIYSETHCNSAAVFTANKVKAACVTVTQTHIANGKLRAIIANSGNANACTGDAGMKAARRMAQSIADSLLIDPHDVAVASTGVIGVPLPIETIEQNIDALKKSLRNDELGHDAAIEAIMTTDTRKKDIAVEIEIDGKAVRIGAMTKGSGMIHPNMATMLAFITTDAAILPSALNSALKQAVKKSFNRLSVDGDTSTNDMAIIMANGEAGNKTVSREQGAGSSEQTTSERSRQGVDKKSLNVESTRESNLDEKSKGAFRRPTVRTENEENYKVFSEALEYVCIELAKKMARDGEGATKLVTVKVTGAKDEDTAETLAKSIVSSSLVKAACFGADANWGRVLCAMGYSDADFAPEKVTVSFASKAGSIQVCKNGESVEFSETQAKQILTEEEIEILAELQDGSGEAMVWGCDLTYDYVKINGDYRS